MGHFNILGHGTQVPESNPSCLDVFSCFLVLYTCSNFDNQVSSVQSSEARIWQAQCGPSGFLFMADISSTGLADWIHRPPRIPVAI